jgi:hypothetical protein
MRIPADGASKGHTNRTTERAKGLITGMIRHQAVPAKTPLK